MMRYSENYKGIFQKLYMDERLNIKEVNFYEGDFAHLYAKSGDDGDYQSEIEFYISQARMCGKKVFEIACGDGRIGIPLAIAGFFVTGVDISSDMLDIYKNKIMEVYPDIKKRITLIQANVCNLINSGVYDLIILPATTICLFKDEEILKIFKFVEEHLSDNGKFIFDLEIKNKDCYMKGCSLVSEYSWDSDDKYNIAIFQEFANWDEEYALVNIYSETIDEKGTNRTLSYTKKRIISKELIEKLVEKSGLKLYRTISENTNESYGIEYLIFMKR